MNSEEQRLRKQLARYGSSVSAEPAQDQEEPPATRSKANDLWSFELPPDWQPEPCYLEPKDCQDHSIGFEIGQVYDGGYGWPHLLIQALPKPTYRDINAKVGDEITNGMRLELARLDGEWYRACRDLENAIDWTRQKLITEGKLGHDLCARLNKGVTDWNESTEKRSLEQTWAFLLGLWAGLKMQPLSQDNLEELAARGWRPNRKEYEALSVGQRVNHDATA